HARSSWAPGDGLQLGGILPGAPGDVEVDPGAPFDELAQEEGCGRGTRPGDRRVLDVGDFAVDQPVVVGPGGQLPYAFAGQVGGASHQVHQRWIVAERADGEWTERAHDGSGQGGDVDDVGCPLF